MKPSSTDLRKAGAQAVLVQDHVPARLPFDVVESKVRVPQVPAGTVSRTALVNRLRAAGAFPLVLVVAPAGCGKTTLLSQWAAPRRARVRLGLDRRARQRAASRFSGTWRPRSTAPSRSTRAR